MHDLTYPLQRPVIHLVGFTRSVKELVVIVIWSVGLVSHD